MSRNAYLFGEMRSRKALRWMVNRGYFAVRVRVDGFDSFWTSWVCLNGLDPSEGSHPPLSYRQVDHPYTNNSIFGYR